MDSEAFGVWVRSVDEAGQVPTGGTARERSWLQARTIRWNSGADGRVRMGEGALTIERRSALPRVRLAFDAVRAVLPLP